jgi:hypothetical protein
MGGAGGNHRGNPWGARGRVSPLVSPPLPCWPDRTRCCVPDLASPGAPGWGGEVRNGLCSALCASGQANRAPARSAGAQ